jgi:hypothetical protein
MDLLMARLQGKPSVFEAAADGDVALVQDQKTAQLDEAQVSASLLSIG